MSESPICQKHITYQTSAESRDAVDMSGLPRVVLQLRSFSAQVHSLLQSHDGSLPLARLAFVLYFLFFVYFQKHSQQTYSLFLVDIVYMYASFLVTTMCL